MYWNNLIRVWNTNQGKTSYDLLCLPVFVVSFEDVAQNYTTCNSQSEKNVPRTIK